MRSRLLTDLETLSNDTRNRVAWSRIQCRIAIHYARQGDPEKANEYIQKVRKHYGVELHHVVASWVMLAEGILHFSQGEMTKSYDRLRRAYGLAVALKTESARPLCAAWMAFSEFNAGKYDLMIEHLTEVLRDANPNDHQARGRACLVVADSLQLAGSFPLARPWYEQTRQHAVAEGDQATLSAYLYNVAAFRTANLRLQEAFSEVSASELLRATLEADSSFSYDMAVRSLAFRSYWKILHSQLLIIKSEFSEAKILLDAIKFEQLEPRDVPIVHCELAITNLKLGNFGPSRNHYDSALSKIGQLSENDDRAYVYKRLSRIAGEFNLGDEAIRLDQYAQEALAKHRVFQAELLSKLIAVTDQFPPPAKKSPIKDRADQSNS